MERERPCECSESLCPCKANCRLPAAKFVKCATVEALCTPCAEYALASYDGAREIDPIDERLRAGASALGEVSRLLAEVSDSQMVHFISMTTRLHPKQPSN
jgi:hypothetical protein